MRILSYLPLFYFQRTRLNNRKAFIFHTAYEWIPVIVITGLYTQNLLPFVDLLLFYLAFISIYEIGYLANDQMAIAEESGRKRAERMAVVEMVIFVVIRCVVFLVITFFEKQQASQFWWIWYGLLSVQFVLHNVLTNPALKTITFSYLAFARFFSPIIVLVPLEKLQLFFFPVFLNYVLFRLITYMDSKGLLTAFDRQSNNFRVGFYCLLLPFSLFISFQSLSPIALTVNAYYLALAFGFASLATLRKS